MKVIVDTNVWSHALRRKSPLHGSVIESLTTLLETNAATLIGSLRQELLSGVRKKAQFEKLKTEMRQFPDFPVLMEDYELAGEFHAICIRNGIQGSPVDILVCAVAVNNEMEIFTLDKDFLHYQKVLPIKLYQASA